jgi:hypothetical protein
MLYVFFWFGLGILRLGLRKSIFLNIELFYLKYLTFYPSKKVAPSPIRVEKKILQNSLHRVSKEAKFVTDLKYVQKS